MAEIVSSQAPLLKAAGFRKRRHSFNRTAADGIVHVVHFWMAPKEPPAWTEVPGLRERLYGSFRLDVGVYVPEMTRMQQPKGQWINEYDCHLRQTIGQLLDQPDDLWWDLRDDEASAKAEEALRRHGLRWLAEFPDRKAVLDAVETHGPLAVGMTPAGLLDVADVYRAIGQGDAERRTLEQYVSTPVLRSHEDYLAQYLQQHGHGDLAGRIAVRDP